MSVSMLPPLALISTFLIPHCSILTTTLRNIKDDIESIILPSNMDIIDKITGQRSLK